MTPMQYGYIRAHIEAAIRGVQEAGEDFSLRPFTNETIVQHLENAKTTLGPEPKIIRAEDCPGLLYDRSQNGTEH